MTDCVTVPVALMEEEGRKREGRSEGRERREGSKGKEKEEEEEEGGARQCKVWYMSE